MNLISTHPRFINLRVATTDYRISFPYHDDNPGFYNNYLKNYHAFKVNGIDAVLGYVPNTVVESFPWSQNTWAIDSSNQSITLMSSLDTLTAAARSEMMAETLRQMAACGNFKILQGWRDERFPVYGPSGELVLEIERSASALFGIITCGVQMICYTSTEDGQGQNRGLRLWIARRSRLKQTYPGMLDSTAAGGLGSGQLPRDAMVCEATEEASLDTALLEAQMKSVGCISYFHVRSHLAGGETGLLQPELEYLYECKMKPDDPIPKPKDSEVEDLRLWTVNQVLEALRNGEFKPNSAVVLIDFLIRHGVLVPETEPRYLDIITRLHRRLPFPIPRHSTA